MESPLSDELKPARRMTFESEKHAAVRRSTTSDHMAGCARPTLRSFERKTGTIDFNYIIFILG